MPPPSDADPGERRLARPPSDRYAAVSPTAPAPGSRSPARGIVFGATVALAGAVAIVALGGIALVTAGLLIVAAAAGWLVGLAVRQGAGATLSRRTRSTVAAILAVVSVGVGQLGLWLYGLAEGGVLSIVEYLATVFGPLPLLEAAAAAFVAWWFAR